MKFEYLCKIIFKNIFFLNYCKKRWFRKKRKELKLYKRLRENNSFKFLNCILRDLRSSGPKDGFHCLNLSCSAISINQYLAYRFQAGTLIGKLFTRSIFTASLNKNKKIPFPVPFIWQSTLRKHGLKVAPIRSFFYWKLLCLMLFIYSILKIIKSKRATMAKGLPIPKKPFTALLNLQDSNLPENTSDSSGYTIVDWFKKNYGVRQFVVTGNFTSMAQGGNKNIFKWSDPLGPLSARAQLKLSIFSLALFFKCLINLVFGNGYQAIMVYELWLLRKSQIIPDENVALEYGFSNSDYIYKPLWAENLETRGASVVLYFYSLNCIPYIIDDNEMAPYFGYVNMTWPKYLVWHEKFAEFLNPLMFKKGKVDLVSPIFFADNRVFTSNFERKILVFDVSPLMKLDHLSLGAELEYFTEKTSFLFFKDLTTLARKHNVNFVIKQKRTRPSYLCSKKSKDLYLRLEQDPKIEILDANISAHRCLENCLGVIAMPFTSPAHIATANSIPAIYYDPSQRLEKGQFASIGVEMLSSFNELDDWVEKLTSK